ncbi:MAG TPA: hypothetical protein VJ927_11100 [Actinomycetota bacterium]|nr:hypothetical protein [Actinomycetota bacterium]
MKTSANFEDHPSGEICPECDGELVLLVGEIGGEVLRCDCGSTMVLVAA